MRKELIKIMLNLAVLGWFAIILLFPASIAAQAIDYQIIARQTSASDSYVYADYSGAYLSPPAINNAGQVVYYASRANPPSLYNITDVYRYTPGVSVSLVAVGENYGNFDGPHINSSGAILFGTSGANTNPAGLYLARPGLTPLELNDNATSAAGQTALTENQTLSDDGRANFLSFFIDFPNPATNNVTQAVVGQSPQVRLSTADGQFADFGDGPNFGGNRQGDLVLGALSAQNYQVGLYTLSAAGSLTERYSFTTPGDFSGFAFARINAAEIIAAVATESALDSSGNYVYRLGLLETNGQFRTLLRTSTPETPNIFQSFVQISLNAANQVAFWAYLTNGSNGLFFWDGGQVRPVLLRGDKFDGDASGPGIVNRFVIGPEALNDQGQIVFYYRSQNGSSFFSGIAIALAHPLPALTNMHLTGGQFLADFVTTADYFYQLERTDSLLSAFVPIGPAYPGTGGVITFNDPSPPTGHAFYRVVISH